METISNEERAREYLLKEHISPLNNILHQCDLKTEFQYHKDIENAFIKGAEWKDEQFKGFLFELSLKVTTPKTDLDKALASAFPMAGLDTIDDVLALLQNNWYDYQTKGTILNE